jgi:hypothetical protein
MTALAYADLVHLSGGRVGRFDFPCPLCGPERRSPANRRRKVLRIWFLNPGFISFHCVRCGIKGHARNGEHRTIDHDALARVSAEAAQRNDAEAAARLELALWLWRKRRPVIESIAEVYLRDARGYRGLIPPTLAFLPASGKYPSALIAAYGVASEPEPGVLAIDDNAMRGIQLTRLLPDGSDRERHDDAKKTIGHCLGSPIMLAPPNDLMGLAIAEGVEDALSAHEATGLGSWASGGASRMPALAGAVPDFIESITIPVDDDDAGRSNSATLARALHDRGIVVRMITSIVLTAAA